MSRRKKLPLFEGVSIENIGAEGKSIARVDNIVVFVKDAVPGDVVDLQVFRKKGRYMEARVVKYLSYSAQRTDPFCEHFGVCGGCKWQHLPYERQLFYKHQQVVDSFRHIAGVEIPEALPILASDPTVKYRNKLEYTFSNRRWLLDHEVASDEPLEHTNALGLHVPGRFDKVVDLQTCYLQGEPTNPLRNFLREEALERGLSFYDHRTNEGLLRNLIIRNTTLGEVMVILSVQFDEPEVYDKILVVNRDSNAIDLSCQRDNIEIFLDDETKNQSYKTKKFIIESINNLNKEDYDKVTFTSFETLVTYKELYLRQMFVSMGLDPDNYDYNLTGRYTFDPPRWFTVNLDLIDTNRKYLKL